MIKAASIKEEVAMCQIGDDEQPVKTDGKPFQIIWDGQVWDIDLWGIPKGSKNLETTMEFVRFSTDTQRLADQTKWISYGPVRKSSLPLVAPEMQPHMPTYPENFKTALQNDFEWWSDNQARMDQRFREWLTGS